MELNRKHEKENSKQNCYEALELTLGFITGYFEYEPVDTILGQRQYFVNLSATEIHTDSVSGSFEVPFKTQKEATVAYNSLRIDQEPSRGGVYKELNVNKNQLLVKMSSSDIRKLRSAISSFFDFLILVVNTIAQYG